MSKFSSRGEDPRGRGPLPHRNCTPVRLGHHRGPRPRAHFQSIKPLGLPSFAFFFPLPPPSLCFTQHTLISPPRYLRLSCHNAKGTLVTDMDMGYGKGRSALPSRARPPRRPHAARHTNKRANVSALMWAWRAQWAVPPRGKEGRGRSEYVVAVHRRHESDIKELCA